MSITSLPSVERTLIAAALILSVKVASARPGELRSICEGWLRFGEGERGGEDLGWEREDWQDAYHLLFADLVRREKRENDGRFKSLTHRESLTAAQAVELAMNVINIPDPEWVCKAWLTEGRPEAYSPLRHKRNPGDFRGLLSHFADREAA